MRDEDIIKEALARFKEADDADSEQRRLRADDVAFAFGDADNLAQWDAQSVAARRKEGRPQRPCITDNRIAPLIRQIANEQRQNKPSAKARPVDNAGDKEVAEIFDGIIRHVEETSNADTAYQRAADYQIAGGLGFFRLVTHFCDPESFDQDFLILPIDDPNRVRMDPFIETPEGSDAQYCLVFDDIPLRVFEADYPDLVPQGWDVTDCMEWVTAETVRVAEYLRLEYEAYTLALLDTGEVVRDPVEAVREHIVSTRKVRRPQCVWYKLTAGAVLARAAQPFDAIPVFRMVGTEMVIAGKRITKGMTRDAKDAQRLVNYYTSNEAEVVALQPKSPWVAARAQVDNFRAEWDAANTDPVSVLVYDPVVEEQSGQLVPPPSRAAPPMMSPAFVQGKLGAIDAVKSATNVYDASLGQRSNETSGIAIRQRDLQSETSNFHYLDNAAKAIKQCARLIVQAAPRVYHGKQVARIVGEDGTDKLVRLNWDQDRPLVKRQLEDGTAESYYNLALGKYDVTITVGPSFTTKRQESAAFMTELARSDPTLMQKAGDIIARNFDVRGADQLADRLRKFLPPNVLDDDDADPAARLQQAQAMLQQMEQALQNADQIATKLQDDARAALAERDAVRGDLTAKIGKLEIERDKVALDAREAADRANLEREKLELERDVAVAQQALEFERLNLEKLRLGLEGDKFGIERVRALREQEDHDLERDTRGIEQARALHIGNIDERLSGLAQALDDLRADKPIRLTRAPDGSLQSISVGDRTVMVARDAAGRMTLQ